VSLPGREAYAIFNPRILLGGSALFLWSTESSRIWYIDASSLLSTIGSVVSLKQKGAADSSRRLAAILAPYDKNHNRKLDPEEYSALAEEPALFELVWSELDQNHNNRIDGAELRFFDFNKNGKIEEVEHQAFLNAVSYYAASLYLFLDKDGDGFLEEPEMKDYCGAFLVTVPGIFQKYDQQKSGKLDLQQWTALVMDLLDRRLTSPFEGLPPLSPVGRKELLEPRVIERYLAAPSQH
jgi:hypothetical protein